jgi:hypothetical protein
MPVDPHLVERGVAEAGERPHGVGAADYELGVTRPSTIEGRQADLGDVRAEYPRDRDRQVFGERTVFSVHKFQLTCPLQCYYITE